MVVIVGLGGGGREQRVSQALEGSVCNSEHSQAGERTTGRGAGVTWSVLSIGLPLPKVVIRAHTEETYKLIQWAVQEQQKSSTHIQIRV